MQEKRKETAASYVWRLFHKTKEPPYYCYYSIGTIIAKPVRKWFSAVFIPTIPFANLRVQCYRWCGYSIGKNVFIGMHCYLDDMCYKHIKIESDVMISYGVYFSCHGRKQGHVPLVIKKGAYIGMRTNITARDKDGLVIGENAVIGAGSLVNKSIPDNVTVAGVPAKIIVPRERED